MTLTARQTASEIFKRAWAIARSGVAKFGGKVKSYFSVALKMARKGETMEEIKAFSLEEAQIWGVKTWSNYDKSRVYFNTSSDKASWYMDCSTNEFFASSRKRVNELSKEARQYFINKYGSKASIKELVSFDADQIASGITELVG